MANWRFVDESHHEDGRVKTVWIADANTDLENGWTIKTKAKLFSDEFWQECDDEYGKWFITKAVWIDEDTYDWIGDIIWR